MNIVLSCNDNPTYFGFLGVVSKYYKKLGHKVYVAYVSDNETLDITCDSLLVIKPVDGYDSGIQAKLARSYFASKLDDGFYTLMDIDQILINIKAIESVIEEFIQTKEDKTDILAFGANAYDNTPEQGKWPMYFTTARPSEFRKLLGLDEESSFEDLLVKYANVEDSIDSKEQTSNSFDRFSDESLFRYCAIKNKINVAHVPLPNFVRMRYAHRIDRSPKTMVSFGLPNFDINFWNQKSLTKEQKEMILSGFFIDSFPARPYEEHASLISDIVKSGIQFNGKA